MPKFTDDDMQKYFLLKSEIESGCMMCYEQTSYVEIASEGHMCSTECHNKFYDMYNKMFDDYLDS